MGARRLGAGDLSGEALDRFTADELRRGAGAAARAAAPIRSFLVALGLAAPVVPGRARGDGPVPSVPGGPLAELAPVFAERLAGLGYRPRPARARVRVLARLSRWILARGLGLGGLDESAVDGFFAAEAAIPRPSSRAAERPVRAFLADSGLAAWSGRSGEAPAGAVVVGEFRRHLLDERGLARATADAYAWAVGPLADRLCAEDPAGRWEMLDAGMAAGFCRERGEGMAAASRAVLASAVRSFVRWARSRGLVEADMSGAVFSHAKPGGRLPRRAGPGDAEAMLAATGADTPAGLRDRAVITLLHRLGLRAGEVANLSLDDIDWAGGTLEVVGKGRSLVLPMPHDVGGALEAYLVGGRPPGAPGRRVFVASRAPLGGLTPSGIAWIVAAAAARAGLGRVSPHQFRHAAATRVVNSGGSLAEAGQLLGHARPASTAIYARLDVAALRPLAREWGV
jgi:site-specific recombinase XerD